MSLTYSPALVFLSVAISMVAAYSALVLTGRVAAAHGRARRRWLLGGGVAMGTGIWSMHFVAMLAARLPVPITHDVTHVLVSLAVGIGASVLALHVSSRPTLGRGRLAGAALLMGGGIAGMHYIGMAGLVTDARLHFEAGRVLLSLAVAVGASLAALWTAFHLRDPGAGSPLWPRLLSTGVLGGAISGMHFTAMSAAHFTPGAPAAGGAREMMLGTTPLAAAVALCTGGLLLLALFAARVDRGARTESARILERITDGFLAFDPGGCCTYANRAAEQLLRRPREAMLGATLHDIFPEAGGSALEGACRRAMAEQATVEVEERHPALGLWLEVHVYPSANGLSVYFRDVTARRRADEALRRREHQLAEAQRIAQVGSWEWDARTGELAWSRELYRIYGVEPESFTPTFERLVERVHPGDRASTAAMMARATAGGGAFAFDQRIVRPGGEVRIIHSQGRSVLNAEGVFTGLTGTCQDITERKEAEHRLRSANRMVDAVIHASPLAVIAAGTDRRVTLWNPAAERIFGWSAEEALGEVNRIVPPGHGRMMDRIVEGDSSAFLLAEATRQRKDGSLVDVSISAAPLLSPTGEVTGGVAIIADITAQRAASAALRESEERFRELAENISEVFWIISPADGRLLYVSPAVERVWGLAPAALLDEPGRFMETVHADDREAVRGALARLEPGGTEIEYRITRPGGEVRWIRDRAFPLRDETGALVRVVGVAEDVTARREAEETVRANERQAQKMAERMRAVASAAAATIGAQSSDALRDVLVDAARRVLPFDIFTFALLSADGERLEYLGGHDGDVYVEPEVAPLRGTVSERVIRERATLLTRRSTDPAAHGTRPWGTSRRSESSIRTPIQSGGEVLGLVTLQSYTPDLYDEHDVEVLEALAALAATPLRNIALLAGQRAAQEALRQSERDYRGLFENAHDAIVIMDPADERVLDVNPRACQLYGYPRERFTRMSMEAVSRDVEAGRRRVHETLQPGAPRQFELVQRAADGAELHVEVTATTIPYRGGTAILSINRDITERRQAEEALRRSQEQLAQAQKMEAVGRLAGGVAHDFNNLLTVIGGNASLALMDREGDAELCEHLDEIRGAAERAANLTRQLLAYSRQQVLQPRLLDLDAVVSGMHKMLSRLIAEDVDVVLKLHGALPAVKADATQMEQVILNLAVNARDAMPDGGQMVIRTGSLELAEPQPHAEFELPAGSHVVLSVADTGCGMEPDTLRRVFEPFFTTKAEGRGTGLGLATVYGIVSQSGGFIEVSSTPGQGTRFDIFLPSAAPVPAEAGARGEGAAALPGGSGTILLVEDDDAVRLVGSRALARSGYQVLQAADGEAGVAAAAAHPGVIHLVVTDVVMPRMGGRELAKRLAETHPDTRVIFTSGFTEDSVLRPETFEPGTHFLPKPYGPAELVRCVAGVMDEGRNAGSGNGLRG